MDARATALDNEAIVEGCTLLSLHSFAEQWPSIASLYGAVHASLRDGLSRSDRLAGRPVLGVWLDWVDMLFDERRRVQLPPGWLLGWELRVPVLGF